MTRPCAHCERPYHRSADTDPHEPDWTLCPDCADLAVWQAPCADCGEPPRGRCRDLATATHYRDAEAMRRASATQQTGAN